MIHRILATGVVCACAAAAADPALTIYNQNFAVVRETIPLDLQRGVNQVRFQGVTAHLEPESVILRDPAGKRTLQILEQNYRNDPVSVQMLLSLYEGKTVEFLIQHPDTTEVVTGKIVRSGYTPAARWLDQPYYVQQPPPNAAANSQPIIEVDGKLRFQLPGTPLFPTLADDTILKPALDWVLQSDTAGKSDAELGYVSSGFNWEADYNVVAQSTGDRLDIVGWVTMTNQSGKTFEKARIKLMAGDVQKLQPRTAMYALGGAIAGYGGGPGAGIPPVTEKTFDEYHLYTLPRPTTLHDRETKQVEFLRAGSVPSKLVYVYDGAKIDQSRYRGLNMESIRNDAGYGTQSNPKVWVMREFVNSGANHLGMPLPKGRARFYRRDTDGRLEFTGEDTIDHTPKDETVRLFTGAAFDLAGERRRTNFHIDHGRSMLDESFEIKVRNHKQEAVEIRVVEHLYRWSSWEIAVSSTPYTKTDSQTIEFRIPLDPGAEKTITYLAHYTW